jgi:hypothetical protein
MKAAITLSAPAPPGGTQFTLSSPSATVTLPATVTVPQNLSSTSFLITTSVVTSNVGVNMSATAGALTVQNQVTVLPLLAAVQTPATIQGGTPPGPASTATIYLNGSAPQGGINVTVSSDHPSVAAVPSSVFMAAGLTRATIPITTSAVGSPVLITLTATYGGTTVQTQFNVVP